MPDTDSLISLKVMRYGPLRFQCQNGPEKGRTLNVFSLRIYCQLRICTNDRWLSAGNAVIDSGAPFAIFPYDVWKDFSPSIRWLGTESLEARAATEVTSFGSDPVPAQLGLIDIQYGDGKGVWIQPTTITGKFLGANAFRKKQPVVLGLTAIQYQGDHPELSTAYVHNSFLLTHVKSGSSASLFAGTLASLVSQIQCLNEI